MIAASTMVKPEPVKAPDGPRQNQSWTAQESQKLLDLYELDLPLEEIAKEIGRTVAACTIRYYTRGKW